MKKTAVAAALIILFTTGIAGALEAPSPPTAEELAKYAKARVTLTTRMGKIVVRFFPDLAPIHVKNFITLAER